AYMRDHLGAEFDAHVNGVTRFGLFVTLKDTGADGLIPVRSLGADYFEHDERLHVLRGRSSGQSFHLGDRLRVRLRQAEVATASLTFELGEILQSAHEDDRSAPRGPARRGPRPRPLPSRGRPR